LLITPGANWQIYAAIACTCNPGDVVLIPNPGFVSYKSICEMLGVIAIDIKMYQGKLDLSAYSPQIISKIRMIILNSPCNPTGKMLTKDEITDIYNFALSNNIWLLSDEIYARMCYEKYFYSASMIDHCDNNVIIVNGFSKSYAMTGWRLGVMTGPENLIRKCQLLLETEQTCVPPFIQYAGVEALRMSQESIQDMMWGLRIKRSAMVVGLRQIGFNCDLPDGAFYVWAKWNEAFGIDVSRRLLEYYVVVAPGSIFGSEGAYHIRLCFAVPESRIKEGLNKIEMAMRLT
jgi:aspartate/methionine/tyrosine aminotransferase